MMKDGKLVLNNKNEVPPTERVIKIYYSHPPTSITTEHNTEEATLLSKTHLDKQDRQTDRQTHREIVKEWVSAWVSEWIAPVDYFVFLGLVVESAMSLKVRYDKNKKIIYKRAKMISIVMAPLPSPIHYIWCIPFFPSSLCRDNTIICIISFQRR